MFVQGTRTLRKQADAAVCRYMVLKQDLCLAKLKFLIICGR